MLSPEGREKFVPCGTFCVLYASEISQTCQKCIGFVSGHFLQPFSKFRLYLRLKGLDYIRWFTNEFQSAHCNR